MDSRTAGTEMALASTPSKASRPEGINDEGDTKKMAWTPSTTSAMMLSSPDAPGASFPRKNPPALSTKARKKKMSLFGLNNQDDDSYDVPKGSFAERGGSLTLSDGFRQEERQVEGSPRNASLLLGTGDKVDGVGVGDAPCSFTSPVRPPRGADLFSSERITPQRNLGGLFASPVPPQSGPQTPTATLTVGSGSRAPSDEATASLSLPPRKLPSSPQQGDERSPGLRPAEHPICRAEAVAAEARVPACTSIEPTAEKDPWKRDEFDPVVLANEEEAISEEPSNGDIADAFSKEGGGVCVSNEALRAAKDGEAMCTLEVLVKHSRERVGVSALASWRVAELKRRLVYLEIFSSPPDSIRLAPRFGGEALEDDQTVGTLDTDVTYEARAVAVA